MLTRNQNDPDGEPTLEQVTAVFQREVTSLRVISYQDASGNVETISTTDEHPFYVMGRGWIAAADLRAGDVVTTPTGGTAVVVFSTVQLLDQPIFVYNIEVASGHTYFVEDGQGVQTPVWVHNTCAGDHHFVPRSMGSQTPYRHPILTHLGEFAHTHVTQRMASYLKPLDMLARKGFSGEKVIAKFSPWERFKALRAFYREYTFGGQSFYKEFMTEMRETLKRGWFE